MVFGRDGEDFQICEKAEEPKSTFTDFILCNYFRVSASVRGKLVKCITKIILLRNTNFYFKAQFIVNE